MTNDAPSSTGDAPVPGEDPDPAQPNGYPAPGTDATAAAGADAATAGSDAPAAEAVIPAAVTASAVAPPADASGPAIGTTPLADAYTPPVDAYTPPVEVDASPEETETPPVAVSAPPVDAAHSVASPAVGSPPAETGNPPPATETAPADPAPFLAAAPVADMPSAEAGNPQAVAEPATTELASSEPTDADTVIGVAPITVPVPDTISGTAPITVPVPDFPMPVTTATAEPSPPAPTFRDRIGIHFAWEGVLLVLVALGVAGWVLFGPGELFAGVDNAGGLVSAWAPMVLPVLLLATALGLSMRAGAVNLAVGHLALVTPLLYRYSPIEDEQVSALAVAGVLVAAGLLLALVVTVFKAPAWAASLVLAIGATWAYSVLLTGDATHELPALTPLYAWIALAATVVVSLAGGALGVLRPIRKALGTCRAANDGTSRRSVGGFLLTWAALIGSTVLAGAAGVLALTPQGQPIPELGILRSPVGSFVDITPLVMAMGIVLLGGTAARGRRGGVFGTLLASVAVTMAWLLFIVLDLRAVADYGVPGAALLLGLLVNWLIEFANRPKRSVRFTPASPVPPGPIDVSIVPGLAPAAPPAAVAVPTQAPAPLIETTQAPVLAGPVAAAVTAEPVVTAPAPPAVPAGQNPYLYRPPAS